MGEESPLTPVYTGKYEDGAVKFELLGEFEVIDHDITDVYPDDMVRTFEPLGEFEVIDHDITDVYPDDMVRTIERDKTITVKAFLQKKDLRWFYKAIGMPAYLRTEYLFPKKKKRGTARRKRRMKVYRQRFIKFINDKYGVNSIGTNLARTIIDKYVISKDELPALAGPFEGEED